jgi:hypothetical protein
MGEVHNEWTSGTVRPGEVNNEWSGTVRPPKPVVPDLGSASAPPPARRRSELAPQSAPAAAPRPSRTLWLALGLVLLVLFVVVLSGRDDTGSTSACDWKPGEAEGSNTFIGQRGEFFFYVDGQQRFIAVRSKPNGGFEHCTIALTPTTPAPAQPGAGS